MAKVTKTDVKDDQVVYTIDHNGEELQYAIPRSFTREEADNTLLSHLKGLENSGGEVDGWHEDASSVSVDQLEKRVAADEKAREEERKAREAEAKAVKEEDSEEEE